jgi:hypothetical protein
VPVIVVPDPGADSIVSVPPDRPDPVGHVLKADAGDRAAAAVKPRTMA